MTFVVHRRPTITIFADASFYPAHGGVVGWAGWARGDGRIAVEMSGPGPRCRDSGEAELWALALFAERMAAERYLTDCDRAVMLQSDSLAALGMILGASPEACRASVRKGDRSIAGPIVARSQDRPALDRLLAALRMADMIYLRHVKGHKRGVHSRSWVNERCDKLARDEALAQIAANAGAAGAPASSPEKRDRQNERKKSPVVDAPVAPVLFNLRKFLRELKQERELMAGKPQAKKAQAEGRVRRGRIQTLQHRDRPG